MDWIDLVSQSLYHGAWQVVRLLFCLCGRDKFNKQEGATDMKKNQLPSKFQERRNLLKTLASVGAYAAMTPLVRNALAATSNQVTLPFENGERELVVFPQKRPLIVVS